MSVPPSIITFCLGGEMVYISPPENFDQALSAAQEEFSSLEDIDKGRISFSVSARMNGQPSKIRIARNAWQHVMSSLSKYEIIEIKVSPYVLAKSETDLLCLQVPTSHSRSNSEPPEYDSLRLTPPAEDLHRNRTFSFFGRR